MSERVAVRGLMAIAAREVSERASLLGLAAVLALVPFVAPRFGLDRPMLGLFLGAVMANHHLLVLVAPPGPSRVRALDVARVARDAGTPVLAIVGEGDRELGALAAETIAIADVPELMSPILAVVPLQLFAYHLAVETGTDPDTLRGHEPRGG